MHGLAVKFLKTEKLHHRRHLRDAHARNVTQTRGLHAVASYGSTVLGHDDQHHLAAASLNIAHKGLQLIKENLCAGLKVFPVGVARQAVAVMKRHEVHERDASSLFTRRAAVPVS